MVAALGSGSWDQGSERAMHTAGKCIEKSQVASSVARSSVRSCETRSVEAAVAVATLRNGDTSAGGVGGARVVKVCGAGGTSPPSWFSRSVASEC